MSLLVPSIVHQKPPSYVVLFVVRHFVLGETHPQFDGSSHDKGVVGTTWREYRNILSGGLNGGRGRSDFDNVGKRNNGD